MRPLIENRKEELKRICRAMNVQRLYAFGSVASDHFREDSDIDFLIAFPDTISVEQYTENYFSLHYKLRELFDTMVRGVRWGHIMNKSYI
ncbi:MAG: nucleotidyltransferase domain-containing protein [Saprospiraceae bacterium]|nr:nucleotidyltransferase domain-containing protein [Saprospiraceae bacterium]